MDDRRIEHFLTLASQLNFSKAAEMLNITQPALSRSIKAMEAELGITLFDRTTNKIRLTPSGVFLAEEFHKLKERFSSTINQAMSLQSGFSGQIRIGVTNGQLFHGIKQILKDYQEQHPDIRLFLLSQNLTELRSMLDNHSLDFAVGLIGDFNYTSRFAWQVVGNIPLRIAVARDHPLASRAEASLHLRDFENDTFILVQESETPAVHEIIRRCNKAGFWPKITEVPDLLSVILWIEAGYGVAALPVSSVAFGNPALKFISLPELEAPELAFIWAKDNDKPIKQAFINFLKDVIDPNEASGERE